MRESETVSGVSKGRVSYVRVSVSDDDRDVRYRERWRGRKSGGERARRVAAGVREA